jgi:hypothetical protein
MGGMGHGRFFSMGVALRWYIAPISMGVTHRWYFAPISMGVTHRWYIAPLQGLDWWFS